PEGKSFAYWTTESENVAIANAQNSTTTFRMPDNRVTVTANYKDGSSGSSTTYSAIKSTSVTDTGATGGNGGSGGSNGGSGGSGSDGNVSGGTTTNVPDTNAQVVITKPGISNTDKASAKVNGSDDQFVVKITDDPNAYAAVEAALINKYGSLDNIRFAAMDISLYDATGTVMISDTSGLTVDVTIPIPDDLVQYGGNNKAAGVIDTQLDELTPRFNEIDGVPCISFTATHFSPYTVYTDTTSLSTDTDDSPATGDPIHPKWFLALGLACISILLFMKRDEKARVKGAV
ncbi:MAG: hypothetical protein J6C33_08850, partial [Lachnospiraceae bacterium]|nr:hypothetical protein [Lachnospiraceae bacterium]